MNEIIKPRSLTERDIVIFISPAGHTEDIYIKGAKLIIENWGFQTQEMPYTHSECGRFSGTIEERIHDLQASMNDQKAKAIFCTRGGYGCVHLLDKLDFSIIKNNPKWLIGYSDITALHLAFFKQGIQSIHGPMARHLTEYSDNDTSIHLNKLLLSTKINYQVPSHRLNINGKAEGYLWGGNLSVLCGLLGSTYTTIPKGVILFIEDIAEQPYKVDRMIWSLKLAGIFEKANGILIGQFSQCKEDSSMYAPIYESIQDIVAQYNIPVAFNFPIGHTEQNFPLIYGSRVKMEVKENAVSIKNT